MAVVQGQAVRRRAGVAPNTLVMAQEGSAAGRDDTVACSVGGCKARLPVGGSTPDEHRQRMDTYYQHALVDHPRHTNAAAARSYFRDQSRVDRFTRGY